MGDNATPSTTAAPQGQPGNDIVNIAVPAALADLLAGHRHVVVDFHATWCGPCRLVALVFAQLAAAHAAAGRVAFAKVDVDDVPEVASRYSITSLPTFTLIRDGEVSREIKGAHPAQLRTEVEAMVGGAGDDGNMVKKSIENEN